MLIIASDNSKFSLNAVGYQFPTTELDGWDSEWLVVSGRVECPDGTWTFRDPCLTTFELSSLADWLATRNAPGARRRIEFTEPNLSFSHNSLAGGDVLELSFAYESSPPWLTEDERLGDGYTLQIPFHCIDFIEASKSVEGLCQMFPERATRAGG